MRFFRASELSFSCHPFFFLFFVFFIFFSLFFFLHRKIIEHARNVRFIVILKANQHHGSSFPSTCPRVFHWTSKQPHGLFAHVNLSMAVHRYSRFFSFYLAIFSVFFFPFPFSLVCSLLCLYFRFLSARVLARVLDPWQKILRKKKVRKEWNCLYARSFFQLIALFCER